MTDFYRFPAMAIRDDWGNINQASKVVSEASEALEQCSFMSMEEPFWKSWVSYRTNYGMELMDVIHAAETALRMEFSVEEVESLRNDVVEKNRKRGYYNEH